MRITNILLIILFGICGVIIGGQIREARISDTSCWSQLEVCRNSLEDPHHCVSVIEEVLGEQK